MWSVIKHLSNAIIPVVQTRCKVTAFDIFDNDEGSLMWMFGEDLMLVESAHGEKL